MNKYIWEGNKVRLRPMEPSDWEKFHNNDLDSEVARLCDVIYFPRSPEGTKGWAERASKEGPNGDDIRLSIETLDGELVGSINTYSCDSRNGTFKYGLGIFRDHWKKGYGTDAVMVILRYYFEELRYQKVTAPIYDFNEGSTVLHEKIGFKQEGRLRRMIYTNGDYHDELIYGLTNQEFKEISKKYYK